MAHELEKTESGQHLYAGSREPAWHRLGYTAEDDMLIEEALDKAWMSGWNVRTVPLIVNADGKTLAMERHQLILRDNPETGALEPIAPIGTQYTPVQNEELGAFAQAITAESDLVVDACGSLKRGSRVFLTLRFPEAWTIGSDKIQRYLLVTSGHDGGQAVMVQPTNVRVVCQNTLSAALAGKSAERFTVRHKGTVIEDKVEQAREVLGLTERVAEKLQEEIDRLMGVKVTDKQFENMVVSLFPEKGVTSKATITRREKSRDALWDLWGAPTQTEYRGTAWGAAQVFTEYADWYTGTGSADKRAERQLKGRQEKWKAHAMRLVLARS